jgi:hypothetical protein
MMAGLNKTMLLLPTPLPTP